MIETDKIAYYNNLLESKSTEEILQWAKEEFGANLTLASSLGPQSIILTKMLIDLDKQPDVFFLDTGRLPAETYALLNECMDYFNLKYRVFFPNQSEIEEFIAENGPNGFYNSTENRKKCCEIRKVKLLKRALTGYEAWISGVRRDQNASRNNTKVIEWDARYNMFKINPMVNWTSDDVWKYISKHTLPYNKLHDVGYPSIGCAPCTRPTKEGEDPRSGRWWWETNSDSECGINLLIEPNSEEIIKPIFPNLFEPKSIEYQSDTQVIIV